MRAYDGVADGRLTPGNTPLLDEAIVARSTTTIRRKFVFDYSGTYKNRKVSLERQKERLFHCMESDHVAFIF